MKEISHVKSYNDYSIERDILRKFVNGSYTLIVIRYSMEADVIKDADQHEHFASKRTEEIMEQSFDIPEFKQRIEECINNYIPCTLVNRKCFTSKTRNRLSEKFFEYLLNYT